ncbi:hypothetical protein C8A00DRAFT_47629 [Chaetomidium leptoderma]|uniref:Uncharacterized protein n=1 Tax=Chaetomidium leptoderma TaxID=669021 RepID=A0AAN6VDI5_9PEZI|nr:hypothetical protein C8A00DRAFT_47629 [Chaetomidium leptoderma]
MGRPDTLGADPYHNRRFPVVRDAEGAKNTDISDLVDPPYCVMIQPMVDFSRITRKVCLVVTLAHQIERELDDWVDGVPLCVRPQTKSVGQTETLKSVKEPKWAKRQKLVLLIRYFNLRILLFGSILLTSTPAERASIPQSIEAIQKCLDATKQTIQVIYQVFYNTTYTVFAASIILVYVTQEATEGEIAQLLKLVGMAIEILETMDECVVAAKAAQMLHRASESAEKGLKFAPAAANSTAANPALAQGHEAMLHLNHYWGPLNLVGGEMELDLNFFQFADLDGGASFDAI